MGKMSYWRIIYLLEVFAFVFVFGKKATEMVTIKLLGQLVMLKAMQLTAVGEAKL